MFLKCRCWKENSLLMWKQLNMVQWSGCWWFQKVSLGASALAGIVQQVCTCWRSPLWRALTSHPCKYTTLVYIISSFSTSWSYLVCVSLKLSFVVGKSKKEHEQYHESLLGTFAIMLILRKSAYQFTHAHLSLSTSL